jgi:hypothetical protein
MKKAANSSLRHAVVETLDQPTKIWRISFGAFSWEFIATALWPAHVPNGSLPLALWTELMRKMIAAERDFLSGRTRLGSRGFVHREARWLSDV